MRNSKLNPAVFICAVAAPKGSQEPESVCDRYQHLPEETMSLASKTSRQRIKWRCRDKWWLRWAKWHMGSRNGCLFTYFSNWFFFCLAFLHLCLSRSVHGYQATLVCFADCESNVTWDLSEQRIIFLGWNDYLGDTAFQRCTRLASLCDPKMPAKEGMFPVRIAKMDSELFSHLRETSSWIVKCFPTIFCCCHLFFPRETWAGASFDVINAVPWNPIEWLWLALAKDLGHRLSGEPSCLRAIVNASCFLQFSTKPYRPCLQTKRARGAEPLFDKCHLPAFACFLFQWQELKHLQCAQCQCPFLPDI